MFSNSDRNGLMSKEASFSQNIEEEQCEIVKAKEVLCVCQQENMKLKGIIEEYGKKAEEKEQILKQLLKKLNVSPSKRSRESHFISALKKEIRVAQEELRRKQKNIIQIQRKYKLTKLGELEMEAQILEQEVTRLKLLLKQALNKETEGYTQNDLLKLKLLVKEQDQVIGEMRDVNSELAAKLREKEDIYVQYKTKLNEIEKNNARLKLIHSKNSLDTDIYSKVVNELKDIQAQFIEAKKVPSNIQLMKYHSKANQLSRRNEELKSILSQKINELKEMKKKLGEDPSIKDTNEAIPSIIKDELKKIAWKIKLKLMEEGIAYKDIRKVMVIM